VKTATRAVVWVKDGPFGLEHAVIKLGPEHLSAEGVAIGGEPVPYRLDYELETGPGFVTTRLRVRSRGEGWQRGLDLRRGPDGTWSVDASEEGVVELPPAGGEPTTLADAVDCDLALSPVTNLMPILRHGLLSPGPPVEITTAWVSVPDLAVQADGQRYTFVRSDRDSRVVRFEATDGTFAAEIVLDPDGIVLDYPGLARRLEPVREPR
jgi:uncharacterized protein